MNLRPIEPGCLCLSLDSISPGECVARYFVPAGTRFPMPVGERYTLADGWSVSFSCHDLPAMVATKHLIRIDGGDELVEQERDMEVSA